MASWVVKSTDVFSVVLPVLVVKKEVATVMLSVLAGEASNGRLAFALSGTFACEWLSKVALAVPGIAQRAAAAPQRRNVRKVRGSAGALDAVSVFTKLGIASSGPPAKVQPSALLAQPKMR